MKRRNESSLTDLLKQVKQNSHLSTQLNRVQIQNAWQDLMGPVVTRYTSELYLRRGVLTISISSAALRHELFMGREKICQRINDFFDREVVKEVRFR